MIVVFIIADARCRDESANSCNCIYFSYLFMMTSLNGPPFLELSESLCEKKRIIIKTRKKI